MIFQVLIFIIFVIALVTALTALKKREPAKRNVFVCGLLILAGVAVFGLMATRGIILFEFSKGGFLESPGSTLAKSLTIDALMILVFAVGSAITVAGFAAIANIGSAENIKTVRNFFIASLITPIIGLALIEAGPYYKNINVMGFFRYLTMKKFEYLGFKWGMPKEQAEKIRTAYRIIPAGKMCGHPGKYLFTYYNFNNHLYRFEATFETKTKKDQDEIAACMRSRYGELCDCKKFPDTWGSYDCRWHLGDTDISMYVEDNQLCGEIQQPRWSRVVIESKFMPPYLHDRSAAAYRGF